MRIAIFLLLFLAGCDRSETPSIDHIAWVEPVQTSQASPLSLAPLEKPPSAKATCNHPPITLEHFRCRGCSLHPINCEEYGGETVYRQDCWGSDGHSLPIHDGQEFIYPILLELLNSLQEQTGCRVVVTAGHRCPTHQLYVDSSPMGETAKYQIGGEVSFYLEGAESDPTVALAALQAYYADTTPLQPYEKQDYYLRTTPLINKEVFVKVFQADEGRDFDHTHPYPYLSIQVRWDRDTGERVVYSWPVAHKGYYRW